jgi:hypothetical protein
MENSDCLHQLAREATLVFIHRSSCVQTPRCIAAYYHAVMNGLCHPERFPETESK